MYKYYTQPPIHILTVEVETSVKREIVIHKRRLRLRFGLRFRLKLRPSNDNGDKRRRQTENKHISHVPFILTFMSIETTID